MEETPGQTLDESVGHVVIMMRTGRKNLVFKGFLCVVVPPELLQSCTVETLFVCEAADALIGADDSRRSLLTER